MTLHELATRARADFERAGIPAETAALDAEILARHVLGWNRPEWFTRRDSAADEMFARAYETAVQRRIRREPVAYIRGVQEFWGRDFDVTPAVLIPRPETELIVEAADPLLSSRPGALVVDIGTGSGCIAVTLALEHRSARLYATDVSEDALRVARRNAAKHGVAERVEFLHGAYLADAPRPVDMIVSNPPYVPYSDRAGLQPEVRDYEPPAALFAGTDGLEAIRSIFEHARTSLAAGGHLIVEIGFGQAERVKAELDTVQGLRLEETRSDLQGIPRALVVRR